MMIPFSVSILNLVMRKNANSRDFATFIGSILTFLCVLKIFLDVGNTITKEIVLLSILPNLKIAFHVEPLGLVFALLASGLWVFTHIYAIGYMRENNEKNH